MLLSVVIPIGNLEKNLDNIKSIALSSYKLNIEMVFVLDTSEISALEELTKLCKSWNLDNFKIIECNGRNPGSSRNLGMLSCTGDWVFFCDSDDMPCLTVITRAIIDLNHEIDILIGSYVVKENNAEIQTNSIIESNTNKSWLDIALNPGLWRWVIKRNFILTESFPNVSMGEDQYFLLTLLNREPKIKLCDEVFYHYVKNSKDSLTFSKSKINDLIHIINLENKFNIFSDKYSNFKRHIMLRQIITLMRYGSLKGRSQAIYYFIVSIFKQSPIETIDSIKFAIHILKNKIKS